MVQDRGTDWIVKLLRFVRLSLDEGVWIDAMLIDLSKVFDLDPHDRLLTKMTATGLDLKVVVWTNEFL
jgi:hypothetical protein